MRDMLRDLVAHKGHADSALLNAIRSHPAAVADPELLDLLHHVLLANRFWLLTLLGRPFAFDVESRVSDSFDELMQRYGSTHAEESAWLERATDADLQAVVENTKIPGGRCSVAHAVMQVCLHSQGHRAQCAKLLRRDGGVPPRTDFILWLAHRAQPDWDVTPSA
jgi:uncharacterized damage-inducible protein DinB